MLMFSDGLFLWKYNIGDKWVWQIENGSLCLAETLFNQDLSDFSTVVFQTKMKYYTYDKCLCVSKESSVLYTSPLFR